MWDCQQMSDHIAVNDATEWHEKRQYNEMCAFSHRGESRKRYRLKQPIVKW